MRKTCALLVGWLVMLSLLLPGCRAAPPPAGQAGAAQVIAVEAFLADIAQNVAGERLQVEALIPAGVDPHAFEPTPQDIVRLANARLIIANGAGLEGWLAETIQNSGGQAEIIEASSGLASRAPSQGESENTHLEGDPHFWLNPINVVHYVENIRDALVRLDPDGADTYARNAAEYVAQLQALDTWIERQVSSLPPERRLLVTNHESFGYYADRYGFQVIGTIIPSVSTGAAPSAQELARLVDAIRQSGAPAIFLETGANPQLARQIAAETGVRVVTDLYSHSLTPPGGPAPTYIDMMRHNTQTIVAALK